MTPTRAILDAYAAGEAMHDIADRNGITHDTVRQVIRAHCAEAPHSATSLRRRLAEALGVGPEWTDERMLAEVRALADTTIRVKGRYTGDAATYRRRLIHFVPADDFGRELYAFPACHGPDGMARCEPYDARAVVVSGYSDTALMQHPSEAQEAVRRVLSGRSVPLETQLRWADALAGYVESVCKLARETQHAAK